MIKFGTSGWRGIIAEDFTFDGVRRVTHAISQYIKKQNSQNNEVIVGYDTRFLSDDFAKAASCVLASNGIKALFCSRNTPTPVIAYEIIRRKAAGGINFTASHNPSNYNGIKFSPAWGGPALPETTKVIEALANAQRQADPKEIGFEEAQKAGLIEIINPRPQYLKRIKQLIDFKAIKKANLKVATDVLYGTGAGYLDDLLDTAGTRQKVINKQRDVLFGGHAPEPSEENLSELCALVKKESCHLGLATDGDADRFGILDTDGSFISPNETIALLLYHMIKSRGLKSGVVARSVMTTHLVDKVAQKFGVEVKETPVGFKYIGEIMVKEGKNFIIGGEESGGLTITDHVPEKDGIAACLLMAEMYAHARKPLKKTLEEIFALTGRVVSGRKNFHLTQSGIEQLECELECGLKSFAGLSVVSTITIDGFKFILSDGSWVGIRLSGTEPVVRFYAEAQSSVKLKKLFVAGSKFVLEKSTKK